MNKKEDLTQIKNRLKELAKLIKLHNEHYHQMTNPLYQMVNLISSLMKIHI